MRDDNPRKWNPFGWTFRQRCLAGFAACLGVLLYALYVQFFDHLQPCPLCTFQRGAFVVLGVVFLLGAAWGPRGRGGRAAWAVLAVLAAAAGAALAIRHVWLQLLPAAEVPACGPDLAYMLREMPMADMMRQVFTGSGECAVIDWTFLGLSMPAWSLVTFLVLGAWAAIAVSARRAG
ncbi:disulfide bond formation protein B [Xanthomonas massiliensis]|jgi:disulfide bond formation protein DsbB|uniref:disulfide bond formation protein B n=1 Tax=Xanthomonas massiliensis TaxID=1720302 RepID=UPI00082495D0|nr:disulfide bond formation protein B [Xanthomonas massiliensis]